MDAMQLLVTEWKQGDERRNQTSPGGYVPCVPVLANRLAGYYEEVLQVLAESVRDGAKPVYTSSYKGRTFWVSMGDNRDTEGYNAACEALEKLVKCLGWRVRLRRAPEGSTHYLYVTLPASIEVEAERVHGPYVASLNLSRGPRLTLVK